MPAFPAAVAVSSEASAGAFHSPAPSSESCRPSTATGSISKALQKDLLAAIRLRSPLRRRIGAFEDVITASARLSATSGWAGEWGGIVNRSEEPEAREEKAVSRTVISKSDWRISSRLELRHDLPQPPRKMLG